MLFRNLSADQLAEYKNLGITLLERLIYELLYFSETGGHLDITNWTICSGSRYSDGNVPYVNWDGKSREFFVAWCRADVRSEYGRARGVIS